MNRILLCLFVGLSTMSVQASSAMLREMFLSMPDSVLPLVAEAQRRDCIDFYEKGMKAHVRNALDEQVELEAMTTDYLRFRSSRASVLEMKLLALEDGDTLLCLVRTAEALQGDSVVLRDSHIRFYNRRWESLPVTRFYEPLPVDAFATGSVSDSTYVADAQQALRSLRYFFPVEARLSPDESSLLLTVQTGALSRDEQRAASTLLQPVLLLWDGKRLSR